MTTYSGLEHFVTAQAPVYNQVRAELASGHKSSHWMWFIFPQIVGLGRSLMAQRFALASLKEACAYFQQPVVGPRLVECTELVIAVQGRSARDIFGTPDDMKFRSSMTLFARAGTGDDCFEVALRKYFAGEPDPLTLERI